jgi:hypothetical protein
MTLPPVVLWADPGKMTGLAVLHTNTMNGPGHVFQAEELEFMAACQVVENICESWQHNMAIGWERFDINESTHRKTQGGVKDAMHMIGVLRWLAYSSNCRTLPEAHQHTPDAAEQKMLKTLGWWVPGKNDAQSAACHMLRWLVQEGELTPAMREALYSGTDTA